MLGGADNLNGELPSYITGANNLTPLIARPWRKAGRRQAMEGTWSGTVAFNPLIGRPWRDYCRVPGHLTTYSSVHDGMLVA